MEDRKNEQLENKPNENEQLENKQLEYEQPENNQLEKEQPENKQLESEQPEKKQLENEQPENKQLEGEQPENQQLEGEQPENQQLESEQRESVTQGALTEPVEAETKPTPSPKKMYKELVGLMKAAKIMTDCRAKIDMYKQLAEQFQKISDYKDSAERSEKCLKLAKKTKKRVKKQRYENAQAKMSNAKTAKDYFKAAKAFKKLKNYKDAPKLAKKCRKTAKLLEKKARMKRIVISSIVLVLVVAAIIALSTPFVKYQTAGIFMTSGRYHTALRIYQKLDDYKDSKAQVTAVKKLIIKSTKPGDTTKIGKNDWILLEVIDNRALVLLGTALPGRAYHESLTDVTWETSDIRKWLNSDFLTDAFSEEDLKYILLSDVKNDDNTVYGTDGGDDTKDYVFLMSIDEVKEYKKHIPATNFNSWLRSSGNSQNSAAFLSGDKHVMQYGYKVDSDFFKIRPVMWVEVE